MAQVPEKVLAWLYSVLHEYYDPQRTYSDTARALSAYLNTINPRTEVFTAENGSSALLLVLHGNLPVAYKGTTYRYPVKVWLPQSYPQEAPIVYVTPGKDMLIRPGQHVGVDGRVYLPYLRDWANIWDRASVGELLEHLQQVFAREPPVISRAQQQQYQSRAIPQHPQQQVAGASSAAPQLPPKQRTGSIGTAQASDGSGPPPRPPKAGSQHSSQAESSRDVARDGPPLPPLPHERSQSAQHPLPAPYQIGRNGTTDSPAPYAYDQNRSHSRTLPYQHSQPARAYQDHSNPVSPIASSSQGNGHPRGPPRSVNSTANSYSQPPPHHSSQQTSERSVPQQQPYQQQYSHPPQQQYHSQRPQAHYGPSQLQQPQKPPPPDLLSGPFDVTLPGPQSNAPAPPIPPNPEKEHILHALSTALVQQAHEKVSQNLSAIAPLQAQHSALLTAHSRLEAEIRQLEHLSATLDSNERILRRAIQDCDSTIASAKSKPQPPIDDVLVAPTIVAQQLWNLTAEEASIREAMYVLQKAADKGRVSADVFVKQMRGLGREAFLKMALARKCAQGMGLDMHG